MRPGSKWFSQEAFRIQDISYEIRYDQRFPFPRIATNLSYATSMVLRHLPSERRLACRYVPFHKANEVVLRQIYNRLIRLSVRIKPNKADKSILTFPGETAPQLAEITIDLGSILLDERLTGYIIVALKKCFSFQVWQESPFSKMTYAELHTAISECLSTSPWSSSLMKILHQVSDKSRFPFRTILKWIHMISISPVASTDPFILDLIQDHDMRSLSYRLAHDAFTLGFFESCCP